MTDTNEQRFTYSQKQLSICTHTVVITILKVSSIARWKSRKRYNFLIDLESIQHKLSSDYSLDIYFSRRFPYIDGPSFSPYKPLQNVNFSKVNNMQCFQELYSHIGKDSGEKFEDMFLVKIASKRTSITLRKVIQKKHEGGCSNPLPPPPPPL